MTASANNRLSFLKTSWLLLIFFSVTKDISSSSSAPKLRRFTFFLAFLFFKTFVTSDNKAFFFFNLALGAILSKGFTITCALISLGGSRGLSYISVSILFMFRRLNIVLPTTFPKIVFFLFSHLVSPNVIKNWERFSFGFRFTIAMMPLCLNLRRWWYSFGKGFS